MGVGRKSLFFLHVSFWIPIKYSSKFINQAAEYTPWTSVAGSTLKVSESCQYRDGFKSMRLEEIPRE